jgi:DNA invertase Pin-like site-specific DNA recombinase
LFEKQSSGDVRAHVHGTPAVFDCDQSQTVERYAAEHNLTIVKRSVDAGRSGLSLSRRLALRQLLLEVISAEAEFIHILVYDVSRWGRFQHAAESAYYE